MKKALSVSLFSLTLLLSASLIRAQDEAQEQAFPQPGEEQKALAQLEGEWDVKMDCKMSPAGPVQGTGTYTSKMDLNGFFLVCDLRASLGEMPFAGRAITGYDPWQKKYVGTWVDSMSPALYQIVGEWDKANKTYTETVSGPGPDGKPMAFTITTTVKDKDHHVSVMEMPGPDGNKMEIMTMTYTRKASTSAATK